MIACLDVDYREFLAIAAGIGFEEWESSVVKSEKTVAIAEFLPYQSGSFYQRELPCLVEILKQLQPVETIIVDGYVWLDNGREGLGARLYRELSIKVPVIGVAKTAFKGAEKVVRVFRGESARPLFVSGIGIESGAAAESIRAMHGVYRIPTMLKAVDRLAKTGT